MISLASPISALDDSDIATFGPGVPEAPGMHEGNDIHYLHDASGFPESLHYATAKNIGGPWAYGSEVMPLERGSNTNHPGVVDYKGNSYFFYHNDALPEGHSYNRSVAVEPFLYEQD